MQAPSICLLREVDQRRLTLFHYRASWRWQQRHGQRYTLDTALGQVAGWRMQCKVSTKSCKTFLVLKLHDRSFQICDMRCSLLASKGCERGPRRLNKGSSNPLLRYQSSRSCQPRNSRPPLSAVSDDQARAVRVQALATAMCSRKGIQS
jgi:hypothetical protein